MALTNAERQAAFKARKAETMDSLTQQNATLLAEVAELRAEVNKLRDKAHRLEVASLKAQISEARRSPETAPKSNTSPKPGSDDVPAKRPGQRRNAG